MTQVRVDEGEALVPGEDGVHAPMRDEEPEPTTPEQPPLPAQTAGETLDLRQMLSAAVTARLEDDGWALLSNVGFQLVGSHPTFDSRNYGYARLGHLVRDQDYLEIKEVPGPTGNQVIHVRLREG